MNSNNDYSTLITGLLCLMLVAFKLLGVINWSWWLVLLPFFIGPAALGVVVLAVGFVIVIAEIIEWCRK